MSYKILDLEGACAALRSGEVVAYPTETFYGLGCDALNPDAVGRVYAMKQRPYGLPLPVVIGDMAHLALVTRDVPPLAERLMHEFWPGPLSIIFAAAPEVPDLLTAATGRVAVRLSPHPGVVALCRAANMVLTASSANVSGRPPVDRPGDLDKEVMRHAAGVYDARPYPLGGEPSTIVDILSDGGEGTLRVLREGAVTAEALVNAGFPAVMAEE